MASIVVCEGSVVGLTAAPPPEVTAAEVAPDVWSQIAADRACIVAMNARRAGADVFRANLEMRMCQGRPDDVLGRPGLQDELASYADTPAFPIPGPDRPTLLSLLA